MKYKNALDCLKASPRDFIYPIFYSLYCLIGVFILYLFKRGEQ